MNLKPELLATLTSLGITGTELDTLKARMMFTVTSLEAQVSALNAQIATLETFRAEMIPHDNHRKRSHNGGPFLKEAKRGGRPRMNVVWITRWPES
jgi:hypothetical protein